MKQKHFTLIELIAVMVVIGIIMLLGGPYFKYSHEIAEGMMYKKISNKSLV